ncbi:MAG: glycerophosphodiester phosphodiesterase [Burkholderiales bacterium]|nr:glycerophosphodiester phosphodiesterase [Burkholderiales bacterium]
MPSARLRRSIQLAAAALAMSEAAAFDLQGHRGARGLAPENTLPAFARALAIGVTTLELDCGVTRDGALVVSHDRRLNPDITRGPGGAWLDGPGPMIHALDYAELARYDVGRIRPGSEYAKRFPDQTPVDGTRIPRLADVFALVARARNATVRFNIETKIDPTRPEETLAPDEFARALVREVRAGGMARRTTIQSFDWRTLRVVQAEAPEIATVYLSAADTIGSGDRASPWTAGLRPRDYASVPAMVKAAGGAIWSPAHAEVTPALVLEAHRLGLAVIPWTANAPAELERLLDLGVDGIITDYPDRLRAALAARRRALPTPTPVER